MARYVEPTAEQVAGWNAWVAERPPHVRALAKRFDPWSLYRLKTTGQRVTVQSFDAGKNKQVTLTIAVTGEFNEVLFDTAVFGIDPNDLEPCDLPTDEVPRGTLMTQQQVDENLDAIRVMVRPDLWVLDEDGTAQRKQ